MKIPKQLIADYAYVCIAFMAINIAMRPVYFGKPYLSKELLEMLTQIAVLSYSVIIAAELFVTFVLRKPFSYVDELNIRFHHFLLCTLIVIPLYTATLNQFLVIKEFGWEHWELAWIDPECGFSLNGFLERLLPCSVCTILEILISMPIISQIRVMLHSLRELKEINQLLESEQTMLRSRLPKDNVTDKIIIHGDSRESLIVNPLDIMYVESVGNYLSIVYFNDSELCQKRLRSSLKEVEETLEAFPFMVHTHRAFLVNINFISQVTGNSAGYKINMFSCERVLPVSRASVALFKDKIRELGKDLN